MMEERTEPEEIPSAEALLQLLEAELGYCGCAYTDAIPFLHELLGRAGEAGKGFAVVANVTRRGAWRAGSCTASRKRTCCSTAGTSST